MGYVELFRIAVQVRFPPPPPILWRNPLFFVWVAPVSFWSIWSGTPLVHLLAVGARVRLVSRPRQGGRRWSVRRRSSSCQPWGGGKFRCFLDTHSAVDCEIDVSQLARVEVDLPAGVFFAIPAAWRSRLAAVAPPTQAPALPGRLGRTRCLSLSKTQYLDQNMIGTAMLFSMTGLVGPSSHSELPPDDTSSAAELVSIPRRKGLQAHLLLRCDAILQDAW